MVYEVKCTVDVDVDVEDLVEDVKMWKDVCKWEDERRLCRLDKEVL